MDTLDKLITAERKANPSEDPDLIVKSIWELLVTEHHAPVIVFPAVRDYVLTNCRGRAREVERRMRKPGDELAGDDRAALLAGGVDIPGKGWVAWPDITVEDLETRIADLERQKADLEVSIAFYRDRIAEMVAAGVTRYGDIGKRSNRLPRRRNPEDMRQFEPSAPTANGHAKREALVP